MILGDFIKCVHRYCEENKIELQQVTAFRNAVETIYAQYKMERKLAYSESDRNYLEVDFEITDEYEEFFYQWNYYPLEIVRSIYTHTGWKFDEEFCNLEPTYNFESGDLFYQVDFFDVYDKVVSHLSDCLDSDICFLYCVLILLTGIDKKRKLYEKFACLVKNALIDYKFMKLLDWVLDGKKQIFIAMSYANDMEMARKAIKIAIENNGYTPMILDEKEYSSFIVPEMLMEIEKSAFIVADLTHQRGGVYYEAGYAQACGIPVIMTCKAESFEGVHFDVRQMNTIIWNNERELKDKLSRRIEAMTRLR